MDELDVYVVRVYRNDASCFAGVVLQIAGGQQTPFRNHAELWKALADFLSVDAPCGPTMGEWNEASLRCRVSFVSRMCCADGRV
jgi:hypothetical protein